MTLIVGLILLAVFVGAFAQRVTGMGFALVAGPFLVLLLDPVPGVVLVNLCGIVSSIIVFARTRELIDWSNARTLMLFAVIGAFPGALIAVALPKASLEVLIGCVIIASLAASLILSRVAPPIPRNVWTASATGLLSGTMNSSAGVGGPALSAFAVLSRWDQRVFAASIQPVFVAMSVFSVIGKLLFDHSAWPTLELWEWPTILAALIIGQIAGEFGAKRIPVSAARVGMLSLAFLGGLLTLLRGLGVL